MKRLIAIVLSSVLALSVAGASDDAGQDPRVWDFDVYLDGSQIGYHSYRVTGREDDERVKSEAKFDVKFLIFTAFTYRHELDEKWRNGCLAELTARTNSNGNRTRVSGEKKASAFVVERDSETVELPPCISTFAYWDPEFLKEPKLLNPQTGEYLEVVVKEIGTEPVEVRGEEVTAKRYKLTAKDMDLQLWYSEDNRWIALESVAKGGRIIRYELS